MNGLPQTALGPVVAVLRVGWKRATTSAEEVLGAIRRHLGAQLDEFRDGVTFRSGNVLAVHVLGDVTGDPDLVLVSTDTGWSNRNRSAIDALRTAVTVEELGLHFTVAAGATAPDAAAADRSLGGKVTVSRVRPRPGSTEEDVVEAVTAHLLPLVGAPSTRAGNVLHVTLLRDGPEHLLVVAVDMGTSPRNEKCFAALAKVADVVPLGDLIQLPFTPAG